MKMKYRAWDESIGQYIHVANIDLVNEEIYGLPYNIGEGQDMITLPISTLESFIGLIDSKGKEIFEGDVVRCRTCWSYPDDPSFYKDVVVKQIISYESSRLTVSIGIYGCGPEPFTIIGNIHDKHYADKGGENE